jgi:uncharacterized RDD family membrane protein YckC
VNPSDLLRQRAAREARAAQRASGNVRPAGFWRRYLAYAIDWLLLAPLMLVLLAAPMTAVLSESRQLITLVQDWMLAKMLADPSQLPSLTTLLPSLLLDTHLLATAQLAMARIGFELIQVALLAAGAAAVYFIGFEASRWQATPGKRLLGISVVDQRGARLDWRRAATRFLAGSLSWMSFNLGHALAGWGKDGRALHDLIAGTHVVATTPMPRWGRWLLIAQLALLIAVVVGLLGNLLWNLVQLANAGLL